MHVSIVEWVAVERVAGLLVVFWGHEQRAFARLIWYSMRCDGDMTPMTFIFEVS